MSVRVLSLVFDGYPGSGSDYLAMIVLADWSNDEGKCFPSIASIARKTRLSPSQARRVVHRLIDDDFVRVIGNEYGGAPGSVRKYQIVLNRLKTSVGATPRTSARAGVHAREGLHGCAETASANASQTVIEPSLTTKGFELPTWVPVNEWLAFVDHRKKLKKPLTSHAMNLAIKELKKIVDAGHKPDDVINEAILKGWQSFYAPKGCATSNSFMEGVL